ncbi:hypothetical protein EXIGUO8H_20780 [Exiguobacterium sp. 8H]|nr:hypothetical protein EXIGUO8A_11847 [Exiguobacterium sp. 8A]VXB70235.1 hypothetical protein EXIGUO8H_20780 [Exiguobacterium sp. 8H]
MNYTFQPLTQEQAERIAFEWRYEGDYAFYNMDADEEDLASFLDADERGDTTFAVLETNEMIGFVTLQFESPGTVTIGLGMRHMGLAMCVLLSPRSTSERSVYMNRSVSPHRKYLCRRRTVECILFFR